MRPLDGVRVLDLTQYLPGAYATLLLADLGAEVVKIENPRGGDPARGMPPQSHGTGVYFTALNRNKRSVALDLRAPAATALVDALAGAFDIVVHSFRPQTAERLRVDAATLRARHPRLIHASISGFGQTGPYVERAAHDINFEALSGILGVTHAAGEPPTVPRTLIGDIGGAMNGAAGILAALYQRERTGQGAAVDVSIHESALMWLLFPAARQLVGGAESDPRELPIDGRNACYNVYETADGEYLALGALEPKFWRGFCEHVGRPDFVALQNATGDAQARLLAEVRALMRTRSRDEWLAIFYDVDVCLTPVNSIAAALEDPHIAARGAVRRAGRSTYITFPIAMTGDATRDDWHAWRGVAVEPAPALGADTDAVLEAVGIHEAERERLRSMKVIF